ncbi:MAG: carbohydrate ABC transporter permease [Lachnospiraceae bacterium]|nr:carbohydrate ABC transporter permease [Lachnospiraceae bacterium]
MKIKKTKAERAGDIVIYIISALLMIVCIYPFYYVIIYSISDPAEAAKGIFLLPRGLDLSTYQGIIKLNDIPGAYLVSILRTFFGTGLTIICSSFFAYLVTNQKMYFRKFVYRFVIITMYINAGLIPWYMTMKFYGFQNNFLLYIIPGAVCAYYVILLKTYMESLPKELEESAKIDGAGMFTIFGRIVFPLSKPILATVGVFSMVGQWNQWQDNYFLVTDAKLQTLQMVLYNYLNQANRFQSMSSNAIDASAVTSSITPSSIKMCITVLVVFPIMCVYPFLQRYFEKGIMMGAVKG